MRESLAKAEIIGLLIHPQALVDSTPMFESDIAHGGKTKQKYKEKNLAPPDSHGCQESELVLLRG